MAKYEGSNPIIKEFVKLGYDASYHYADDSGGEWDLGHKAKREALEIYDSNPELQKEMKELSRGFLWVLNEKEDR